MFMDRAEGAYIYTMWMEKNIFWDLGDAIMDIPMAERGSA